MLNGNQTKNKVETTTLRKSLECRNNQEFFKPSKEHFDISEFHDKKLKKDL